MSLQGAFGGWTHLQGNGDNKNPKPFPPPFSAKSHYKPAPKLRCLDDANGTIGFSPVPNTHFVTLGKIKGWGRGYKIASFSRYLGEW